MPLLNILDLPILNPDRGTWDNKPTINLRQYFQLLTISVWEEGENFSGKRPFGNSDWQSDVCEVLEAAGYSVDNYWDATVLITEALKNEAGL